MNEEKEIKEKYTQEQIELALKKKINEASQEELKDALIWLEGFQCSQKRFEKVIDKKIKIGCGERIPNIVIGKKIKLPDDVCGKKGFLCFDCKQRLKLKKELKKVLIN